MSTDGRSTLLTFLMRPILYALNHAQWTFSPGPTVQTVVNIIPILATLVTTFLSMVLARATLRYVAATDKGFELAREQFEREWAPELHVRLEKVSEKEAKLMITNLARASVLLELVQIRKLHDVGRSERFPLNHPLVGGLSWSEDIGGRLFSITGKEFNGAVAVCITFFASGRLYRSDWFRFDVQIDHGQLIKIAQISTVARRVRVLETRTAAASHRKKASVDAAAPHHPTK